VDLEDLRDGRVVVMKHYPPGFKADAVALYESRPESTIKQIAADQG